MAGQAFTVQEDVAEINGGCPKQERSLPVVDHKPAGGGTRR
jgi:hypothetical protein